MRDYNQELRDWINQELKQRSWSRRELARRASLSQAAVQKILAGERNPSAEFCIKVAQALGESPEKLLRMSGILPKILFEAKAEVFGELIDLLDTLSYEQHVEVLNYVKYLLSQEVARRQKEQNSKSET